MKPLSIIVPLAGTLAAGSMAFGHGAQVHVGVQDGAIVTRTSQGDPARAFLFTGDTEVFGDPALINNWSTAFPGFTFKQNDFADAADIRFRVLNELLVWNGADFVSPGAEELRIQRSGLATPVISTGDGALDGFVFATIDNTNSNFHRHLSYTLLGDGATPFGGDDGVYLLQLSLLSSDGAAESASIALLLLKDADASGEGEAAALAFARANIVPEPGAAGLLLAAGSVVLRRRRRYAEKLRLTAEAQRTRR